MTTIGDSEIQSDFQGALNRVAAGESLTITREGRAVARLVPVDEPDHQRALAAAERIRLRRSQLKCVPVDQLIASVHEGHRY